MEADISIWRKTGHFYFALTVVRIEKPARCKTAATEPYAAMLPRDEACRSRFRAACLWEGRRLVRGR